MSLRGNNFSSRERKTIILLSVVILFTTGILIVLDHRKASSPDGEQSTLSPTAQQLQLRPFDPNTVDSVTLATMGIDNRKIRNLLNYRRKNGKFYRPDDLARLYTWTAEDLDQLYPYITIENTRTPSSTYRQQQARYAGNTRNTNHERPTDNNRQQYFKSSNKFRTLTIVDANTADSTTLCSIPGIGTTISSIIIRRRTLLGGFHTTEQLLECKYFTPDLLPWFTVQETPDLQKIPLNTASFYQLVRHPYISKEQTQALLQYRQLYGKIADLDALRHTNIFTEEELTQLSPYLTF